MTEYIQGPTIGKAQYIREAGGILLEQQPFRMAPSGAYVCVVNNGPFDAAAVVADEADLKDFGDPKDQRVKWWLHVSDELLKDLLGATGA